jgi:tetratricopeptide (TPR) repeat protein
MDGGARRSANRQSQAQNKSRLVLGLFSLFTISLTAGASLGAQADQLAKNGDARAQNNGAPSGSSPSQEPKVSWQAIDWAVAEQLSVNDLREVIKSLPREAPIGNTVELMRQLNIFVRAGHRHRAAKVIERLPKGDDESYENNLSSIADFLIGRLELDLTRRLFERFPYIMPHGGSSLIYHWAKNGDLTEIDRWLAARMEDTYSYRPPASRPSRRRLSGALWAEGSYDRWLFIRLGFRTEKGTEGELLDSLADEVRSHPADLTRSMRYLKAAEVSDAARSRNYRPGVETVANKVDIGWMGDICKPALAFDCYLLGKELAVRSPRAAIALFERALSLPFTDQDKKLMDETIVSHWAFHDPSMNWEKSWRDWTRLELARSYKANDQASKAQPIIEELTAAYPDGLPNIDLIKFAGQVQAASGARVVENRVVKAEVKNTNSVEYWRKRAEYYTGRNEKAEAIEAYERALALAPFVITVVDGKEYYGPRLDILSSYVWFLGGPASSPEAKQMLWDEFKKAPLSSSYAKAVVGRMISRDGGYDTFFGADQSLVWDFLSAQREWGDTERGLLGWMWFRFNSAEREALWDRAEKLARGASPTRAQALSRALMSREAYLRAIPVLKDAINRLTTEWEKRSATSDLYRAYINTNNWKAAEEMWPSFHGKTGMPASPEALGEIAVAAARAQAPDEAMRFWRAKTNLDLGNFNYLSNLAQLGLKERLRNFYLQLAKDDPESWAPMAALQLLQ